MSVRINQAATHRMGMNIYPKWHIILSMDETLKAQSDQFSMLLTQKLIDAIKEKGFKTTVVAKEIGIGQASMSRYINGVREMPMSTFMAICTYADINPQRLFNAAYTQTNAEPIEINPAAMTEEQKKQWTLDHMQDYGFAANENHDKVRDM
ncbi:MAG: helix-turn-helix transcriptional regulator [Bifidobacterium crudilactis]|nr:helix-turn-helix transcriptional regulator [Bifidobacterium crudilactis]